MTGLRVHTNGPAAKERAELNPHMRDDQKEMRDGVAGDGQRLSEEDESRIKEDADDVNGRRIGLVQARALPQGKQQQQKPPQGIVVWEQFLPLRSLKVMLVENDNSTRHVVSALLRNCGYEVTAVTNCLEAWRILEDLHNHIDLVLTEVVMPILSGIGLLSKIMNHKSRKTIPVIMMSSNDSMGIVFRCLSKGAVDFLGKPIRKNELKNLWQHVWRKCHSSSGSGSESGIRTQKSTLSVKGSHDQTWGNGEDDNCSVGLNLKDGSDKGSGTQSSWSKRPVEVDRPQPTSPQAQSGDLPDSTCAQVIHSRADVFSSNQVPMAKDYCRQDLDNIEIGKDLEIGVPRNRDPQLEDPREKLKDSETDSNKLEKGKLEFNPETANSKLRNETSNLLCIDPPMEGIAMEVLNDRSKVNDFNDKVICDGKEMPSLKFSLRRQRDAEGTGTSAQDRNVLRRSDLSAFSRYNNASTINQTPTENVGCCSPFDNGLEAAMRESIHNLDSSSTRTANQQSNGSSNNNNMGSTTNNILTHKPLAESPITTHSCSAFQPVQNGHIAPTAVNTAFAPAKPSQQQVQVQHHHHHYHHHHHHLHKTRQQQQPPPPLPHCNDLSMKNTVVAPPANVVNTLVEGNAANYSSASGSQNGSNEQNGNSGAAVIAEGINTACDNGSGGGSRSAVNQDRFAQREAALSKFRQKRKERCFEKKVRYQSRKRLAEQRPRVRGQFVRQTVNGNQNKDTGS